MVTSRPCILSAAAISEPMNPPPITTNPRPVGQLAGPPVVVQRSEVDEAGRVSLKPARAPPVASKSVP